MATSPGDLGDDTLMLAILAEGEEVAGLRRDQVPVEISPSVPIVGTAPDLVFVDSAGNRFVFDLSSAIGDGATWLHYSIRVGETFAVQTDVLLGGSEEPPVQAFQDGESLGIRVQPFLLPECEDADEALHGHGLNYRGFHFPGTVTPGNVSLLCLCDSCRRSFRLQSFHAGFSEHCYFYCGGGPHTLIASSRLAEAPGAGGPVDAEAVARFEAQLPPCTECGGAFAYLNPFPCPHCGAPYIDFARFPDERPDEPYGVVVYGDSIQGFKE